MKKIAVLGGAESGTGAAILAKKKGFDVFLSDRNIIAEKYRSILIKNKIPFEEKGHVFENLEKADIIIKSPGIPEDSEVIRHFRLRQKEIISEIEWGYRFYDGRLISVTGSNGKTTTASLIYHLIKEDSRVALAGNVGNSFCALLAENADYRTIVLELSSFQLDGIVDFKCEIAAILNISSDHLDRYENDIEKYADAKWKLAEAVYPGGHLIVNGDDPFIKKRLQAYRKDVTIHRLSAEFPMTSLPSKDGDGSFEIQLIGKHNLFNAAVAFKAAELAGIDRRVLWQRLAEFSPLPHRLETVATIEGIDFIDDSKATNVESVKYALEAMKGPVIWIAGGVDKGNDYGLIEEQVRDNVKALLCLCVDDSRLREAFGDSVDKIYTTKEMAEAVKWAYAQAEKGDKILLSPACASFDLFDNYEHRGNTFKNEVLKILGESID